MSKTTIESPEERRERLVRMICEELFKGEDNHTLFYGKPKHTLEVLRKIYDFAGKRENLRCSWHDASKIKQPMDFFEPVLRLKYGEYYEQLAAHDWFKDYASRIEKSGVFQLASLCAQEDVSEHPTATKMPIFFIDGIEKLFFNMDYRNLDKQKLRMVMTKASYDQPLPRGFGDCLRGYLHQTGKGIFFGSVRDTESIEFKTTMLNMGYLFYCGNFRECRV